MSLGRHYKLYRGVVASTGCDPTKSGENGGGGVDRMEEFIARFEGAATVEAVLYSCSAR